MPRSANLKRYVVAKGLETVRPLMESVAGPYCPAYGVPRAVSVVTTGPPGVPDCAVIVVERRTFQGARQVTPVRDWLRCHILLRVSPVQSFVTLPRTEPRPPLLANFVGSMI